VNIKIKTGKFTDSGFLEINKKPHLLSLSESSLLMLVKFSPKDLCFEFTKDRNKCRKAISRMFRALTASVAEHYISMARSAYKPAHQADAYIRFQ